LGSENNNNGSDALEARLEAHEHLLRHLVVTVLARSEDPEEALDGFQKRLTAPLRRQIAKDPEASDSNAFGIRVREIIDAIAKTIREDIQRALAQVSTRRK